MEDKKKLKKLEEKRANLIRKKIDFEKQYEEDIYKINKEVSKLFKDK